MPRKYERCVESVEKAEMKRYGYEKYNPYAVCHKSLGIHPSHKKSLQPLRKHMMHDHKFDKRLSHIAKKGLPY